jgi:hypothetical protein
VAVEGSHETGGGAVVHLPEAHHEARRAGVEEGLRQADQTLAADLLAEAGLAAGEDDQIGGQVEVQDLVRIEQAVLRPAVLVDQREDQARELGMVGVGEWGARGNAARGSRQALARAALGRAAPRRYVGAVSAPMSTVTPT